MAHTESHNTITVVQRQDRAKVTGVQRDSNHVSPEWLAPPLKQLLSIFFGDVVLLVWDSCGVDQVCYVDWRSGGSPLYAGPPLSHFSKPACVCFYVFVHLYACWRSGCFLSQHICCRCSTVSLIVCWALYRCTVLHEAAPPPLRTHHRRLPAWLQHLLNIQPFVPGTPKSFLFLF